MSLARVTLLLCTALLGLVQTVARASEAPLTDGGPCGPTSCCCEDAGAPAEDAVAPAEACPCNEPAPAPGERPLPASAPAPVAPEALVGGGDPAPAPTMAPPSDLAARPNREVPPASPPRVLLGVRLL